VSVSLVACTLTLDRWVPKWTPFSTLFWLPPAQPLSLAVVDPTDRDSRVWEPVPSCPQFGSREIVSFILGVRNARPRDEHPGRRVRSRGIGGSDIVR
jgi:hypothetical protein